MRRTMVAVGLAVLLMAGQLYAQSGHGGGHGGGSAGGGMGGSAGGGDGGGAGAMGGSHGGSGAMGGTAGGDHGGSAAMGGSTGTGHGMASGTGGPGVDHAPGSGTHAGNGGQGMAHGQTVAHTMTPMMQEVNHLMGRAQDVMRGDMSHENMAKMSHVMNDMSKALHDMGKAMDRGKVSDKQMQTMHDRLTQMKTTLDGMQQNYGMQRN